MKNSLIICMFFFVKIFHGQISLNSSFLDLDRSYEAINMTKLSNSGYKFYRLDKINSNLIIYNLDFSIHRTIGIPLTLNSPKIYAVSEDLFDSDNTTIEFLVNDFNYVGSYYKPSVSIINETGSILFQRDSCSINSNGISLNDPNNNKSFIVRNSSGSQMILTKIYPSPSTQCDQFIYDLPGQITCQECADGLLSLIQIPNIPNLNDEVTLKVFPNPSNQYTTIEYTLPKSQKEADIFIYSSSGKEVIKYNVEAYMNKLELKNSEFSSGTYFITIITNNGKSQTEKWLNLK